MQNSLIVLSLGFSLKITLCACNFCQDVATMRPLVCGCCCLSHQSILSDGFLSACDGLLSLHKGCGWLGQHFQSVEHFTQWICGKCWLSRSWNNTLRILIKNDNKQQEIFLQLHSMLAYSYSLPLPPAFCHPQTHSIQLAICGSN